METNRLKHQILLVGGTFCPPHRAHMELAKKAQERYGFDDVIFIPCKSPVLDKKAHASVEDRLAMLRLAIEPFQHFSIDLCEINRSTPSYMATTLAFFRERYGEQSSLTLLIGMDNFLQLPRWHDWESILKRCHLLVADRPPIQAIFNQTLKKLLQKHQANTIQHIGNSAFGTITFMHEGQYHISSTDIRENIKERIQNKENTDDLISPAVRDYIEKHNLF